MPTDQKTPAILRAEEALQVAEKELADFEERRAQRLPSAQEELDRATSTLEHARYAQCLVVGEATQRLGLLDRTGDDPSEDLVDALLRWSGIPLDEKGLFLDARGARRAIRSAAGRVTAQILNADPEVMRAVQATKRAQGHHDVAAAFVRTLTDGHRFGDRRCGRVCGLQNAIDDAVRTTGLPLPAELMENHDEAIEKLLKLARPHDGSPEHNFEKPVISWPPVKRS